MKWIDLPPFWLFLCLVLTWLSPWSLPWGKVIWLGWLLVILAAVLLFAALIEFRRASTTVIPRESPNALITGGIFRVSRNPIYLADLLVLAGFSLIWGKWLGLLLVPIFAVFLQRRFVFGEEARLREAFGTPYDDYVASTRRWL